MDDQESLTVEELGQQMLEEIQSDSEEEESTPEPPAPSRAQKRITQLIDENKELKGTLSTLEGAIRELKSEASQKEQESELAKGNIKGVIQAKDQEIQERDQRIAALELDIERLKIGREYDIPDRWATRIPGATREEIEANAVVLATDFVGSGRAVSDVTKTVNIQDQQAQKKHHRDIVNF